MKKFSKILSVILSVIVCAVCFVSCKEQETPAVSIALKEYSEPLSTHSKLWQDYLKKDYADIKNELSENSYPETLLEWDIKIKDGYSPIANAITLKVSKSSDMKDPVTYTKDYYEESVCVVYNLKPNVTYYWTVSLKYKKDGEQDILVEKSDVSYFSVKDEIPKNYYVGGVTNVRETGGYPTNDNKTLKTGLLFRSGKLDNINKNGKSFMQELGIKTEIDLRIESETYDSSVLDGVTFYKCGMHSDTTARNAGVSWQDRTSYLTVNKNAIKDFFGILAKEENYPINYHCSIGTDRTGVVAFLVEALLDVKTEWVMRDYLLSNYAKIDSYNRVAADINTYVNFITNNVSGNTLADKTYNYLKSIGVSASDLNSVIKILKG